MAKRLGIDMGATGIKGAIVDTNKGKLLSDRIKYPTPKSSTPKNIISVIQEIISDLDWKGKPLGLGVPAIVKNGVTRSATNIDKSWINYNIKEAITKKTNSQVVVLNDADAAGYAELAFGQAKDVPGICILITLGTGIGSAMYIDGVLIPNSELGMLKMRKGIAENYAANSSRVKNNWSWSVWGENLNEYLNHLELLFSPTKIVISGGVSKQYSEYKKYISLDYTEIVPAKLLNNAGIIGAAMSIDELL